MERLMESAPRTLAEAGMRMRVRARASHPPRLPTSQNQLPTCLAPLNRQSEAHGATSNIYADIKHNTQLSSVRLPLCS